MIDMSVASAADAIMRLTTRDHALIVLLQELRYLTVTQIQHVCYPSISVTSASQRLGLLRRRGLLDCLTHRTFSDRRAFWALTPLGRAVGRSLTGASPRTPHESAVASLQIEHLIATNQIFCDLCLEYRAGRLGAFRWYSSHHARIDLGETSLVPDAVILASAPRGQWWMYLLERDRHTMAREALAEKFDRYRLFHRIAALRRDDPLWEARGDSWVLFACEDTRRARDAAHLASARGLERLWAGVAADLAAALAGAVGRSPESAPPAPPAGLVAGITCPADAACLPAESQEGDAS
jgi:protein involved in plasmid replication-relaxation